MGTPIEWLEAYQVNRFAEATGGQSDPRIIGLSNGNFLVAWTEAADGAIAGGQAGSDIIAKIYDAEGTVVRNAFRLNVETLNDEGDFDIAATNDGGFVLVYLEDETAIQGNSASSIHWGQFDAGGGSTDGALLASEVLPDSFLANPQVTVDQLTNQSIVTFTRDIGPDTDVRGVTVNQFGLVGAEFDAANNSASFDGNGDVAILANGDIVSVYEEDDGAVRGIEFKIFDNAGGFVTAALNVSSGENRAPKVATLLNGNFVVVYHASDSENGNIEFQIFDPNGNSVAGPFNAANGADNQNEPNVVALPDGDFLIAWDNETDGTLEARRLNADGTLDAGTFTVVDDNVAEIDLGLTGDGRVLFTWRDGEIFASIWDPRGAVIDVTDYDLGVRNFLDSNVITTGPTDTTVIGTGRAPGFFGTVLGQAGDDLISGGLQASTIEGGGGNDTIISFEGEDELDGGTGVDTLDYSGSLEAVDVLINALGLFNHGGDAEEDTLSGFEIMIGSDFDDSLDANGFDTTLQGGLGDDLLNGPYGDQNMLGGDGNDTIIAAGLLKGERGDDSLTGDDAGDTIFAGVGADIARGGDEGDSIQGGGGADLLFGEDGDDTVFGDDSAPTSSFGDSIDGGAGNDLLFGGQGGDTIDGGADSDTIAGFGGADALSGGGSPQDFVVDTLDYSASTAAVNVLLNSSANSGGDAEGDALSGFEAIIGSDFDDTLDANNFGFFTFQGGLGDDLLIAGDNAEVGFARTLDGGGGRDTLLGGTRADTLLGEGGDDSLAGGSDNDSLSGGGSDDTLNGGLSGDTLDGGDGIDVADYSDADVKVIADLQVAALNTNSAAGDSYVSIENLLGSSKNDQLRGDGLANILDGADKDDVLNGRDGDDTLIGGEGTDKLKGAAGADQFLLDNIAVEGPDRLLDFNPGDDVIALVGSVFGGLAPGALNPNNFVVANAAQDADDFFVYKDDVDKLFYDADGNGAGAAIQIATNIGGITLSASDLIVI